MSRAAALCPLWRQILADVLDSELVTVNTTEGAAYGAALLAGGRGRLTDVDTACDAAITVTGSTLPQTESVAAYQRVYDVYRGPLSDARRRRSTLAEI
ncbi:MAG: hypothetical protein R2838_07460 [Caldilineaceae bacterium]